jgi:RluA family pseudouridine synthase
VSGLRLLFSHPELVVVDKPAGLCVIPGRDQAGPSARALLEQQLGRRVWVVHRLDRDTSGALVFALGPAAHRTLSMAFEEGRVDKRYLALVQGAWEGPAELRMPLVPARRSRMRAAKQGEAGKAAHTRVSLVERFGPRASLLEAVPLTGRTHQIRVHLQAAGHPLLVDHQYGQARPLTVADLGGPPEDGRGVLCRTPLHASRVAFGGLGALPEVQVQAPLPEDLAWALRVLRAAGP